MKCSKCFVLILGLLVVLRSQERKLFWDGHDWLLVDKVSADTPELNFWIKTAYLCGLFDSKLFYQLRAQELNSTLPDSLFNDLLVPTASKRLIAAIDMFYRDPAQRYLPLPNVLVAVFMTLNGYPEEEVKTYLARSRRWINSLQSGR